MSDTRYLKVDSCLGCPYWHDEEWCGRAGVPMTGREGGKRWVHCPLPRLGDIPEVRALVEAASEMLSSPVEHEGPHLSYKVMQVEGYKIDALTAALAKFEAGGEIT